MQDTINEDELVVDIGVAWLVVPVPKRVWHEPKWMNERTNEWMNAHRDVDAHVYVLSDKVVQ